MKQAARCGTWPGVPYLLAGVLVTGGCVSKDGGPDGTAGWGSTDDTGTTDGGTADPDSTGTGASGGADSDTGPTSEDPLDGIDLATVLDVSSDCGDIRKVAWSSTQPGLLLVIDLPPQNGGMWAPGSEGDLEVAEATYELPAASASVRLFVGSEGMENGCDAAAIGAVPAADHVYEAQSGRLETELWSEDICIFTCDRLFITGFDLAFQSDTGLRHEVAELGIPR